MRSSRLHRLLGVAVLFTAVASAQLPKPFYAWWSKPKIVEDLNLTVDQKQQIRGTIREYRVRLTEIRTEIDKAEMELEDQFDQQYVDARKSSETIDRLAAARADLTKTISQMSLKLRSALTQQQWLELQKRRPPQPGEKPALDK